MRVEEGIQPVGIAFASAKQDLTSRVICDNQVPFIEDDPYHTDPALPSLLKRLLPTEHQREIIDDLKRFSSEVIPGKLYSRSIQKPISLPYVIRRCCRDAIAMQHSPAPRAHSIQSMGSTHRRTPDFRRMARTEECGAARRHHRDLL